MSLTFRQQLDVFVADTRLKEEVLFTRVVDHVGRSITVGSAVTGAPGQPVKTGRLLRSWRKHGSLVNRLVTWASHNVPYATIIEENLRGAMLRSKVGGFHSVELTKRNFPLLVRYELSQIEGTFAVHKGGFLREPTTGRFAKSPR